MPPKRRRPAASTVRGAARAGLARQRGAAALILLALISVVITYAVVDGLNRSAARMAQARAQKTAAALAQAKEALIAYAVTYGDDASRARRIPGFLPCPDRAVGPGAAPEGEADTGCGNFLVSVMGRLPWKTLGLDALKDGSGECLWYAVSGTYKNNPNGVLNNNNSSNNMMNWDTNGQFMVFDTNGNVLAGSTEDERAVAVIFAPGAPLAGQDRTPVAGTAACGGNYTAAAYLETANAINNSTLVAAASPGSVTGVSSFVAGGASDSFNDKLQYITRADIWNAIKRRSDFNNSLRALTRRAAECTAMYATKNRNAWNQIDTSDKRLPWAADVSMSSLDRYAVDRRYRDVTGNRSGRLSYLVRTSDADTNNLLANNTDLKYTDILLLTPDSYCAYAAEEKIWYDNWKDHLFYAVAEGYMPSAPQPTAACTGSSCLQISDGVNSFTYYAAVVIFAGETLSGQHRNTLSDKGRISNYLEASNTSSNNSGNNVYRVGNASSAFNDFLYAIDANLTVKCYDAASGTMKSAPSAACP